MTDHDRLRNEILCLILARPHELSHASITLGAAPERAGDALRQWVEDVAGLIEAEVERLRGQPRRRGRPPKVRRIA